jgi:putative tryptophan/tyrosine transport system substrate-binding protein
MKRRELITLLGGAAFAWPIAVRAQQPALPVIGWLNRASADLVGPSLRAFRQSLNVAGYVEGQNVAIEYRWGGGRAELLPEMAADLVRRNVTVIMAGADSAALAAKAATATIPIVFTGGNDPVRLGLVASLNRPGANLTGIINLNIELTSKRLELLREMVPAATNVTALINPTNPSAETITNDLQAAARRLGLQFGILRASNENEIDAAFANLVRSQGNILAIGADAYYMTRNEKLGALTVRDAVPAIFQTREFAVAGGLASYGTSITDQYRAAATYVVRILKGEHPQDLPVQQVTKVELFINLKTAKALGITLPLTMLGRADEVIE